MKINALEHMHYSYIWYNAAKLAKRLNYDRISVIEYGVVGGTRLIKFRSTCGGDTKTFKH